MDFLGVGPMEILVIVVIILIVFGPNRLPEMARSVGKAMKDVKSATADLGKSLSAELEEEERRARQEIKTVTSDLSKSLNLGPEEEKPKVQTSTLPPLQEKTTRDKNKKQVK